ncbi:MAG: Lrp/AsnC family transcriptional regulator [Desulfurococcales archaeon]|nr:Lrp/AsnC family transcriptional regulator [Desulfurococcales archaeon]
MAGISELEKKALKLIEESSDGILQSDLWKMMNLDSREGSRLVLRLVKKGLVKREQVVVNGRRTYRLTLAKTTSEPVSVKIDISSILDIPCATCPFINDCGPRNFHDPRLCPLLDRWLRAKIRARAQEREISRTTSM